MKILLCSSEAIPFVKTGGLADVATSLSIALASAGHDVTLMLPCTPRLMPPVQDRTFTLSDSGDKFSLSMNGKNVEGEFLTADLHGTNLNVVLVDQPYYFERPGLYLEGNRSYPDNCERFCFFSRAVIEYVRRMDSPPDIVHANDWQTGLVPILVSEQLRNEPGFENIATMFTIHNMNFQGRFWHWDMQLTGLDWEYFNWQALEYYGDINLLKAGILFAEKVTTVSPTYANEIQTEDFGCGLDAVLRERREDLSGILNGVDLDHWSPENDSYISTQYNIETFEIGKAACKVALQNEFNLPQRLEVPIVGMVSRMSEQKGFDLIRHAAGALLDSDVQYVFLGTGESEYEQFIEAFAKHNPEKVAAKIGFSEALAHQIEAGSDIFLMPSRFEPCGLNQMYSMVYGTLPVVHEVGGLADSVTDLNDETLANHTATGFTFTHYNADALSHTLHRAYETFDNKEIWNQMIQNGMRADWSWKRSAEQYVELYQQAQNSVLEKSK